MSKQFKFILGTIIVLLFVPFNIFVTHPERVSLVALLFIFTYLILKARNKEPLVHNANSLLLPALLWILYIPWESYCTEGKYNLRVDLLLIYPILGFTTFKGLVETFKGTNNSKQTTTQTGAD